MKSFDTTTTKPVTPRCTRCDRSVPAGLIGPGAATQFCSSGCREVYELISGRGLADYCALREATDGSPEPAKQAGIKQSFEALGSPDLLGRLARTNSPELIETELTLEGVSRGRRSFWAIRCATNRALRNAAHPRGMASHEWDGKPRVGWQATMLIGDHHARASQIAGQVGIDPVIACACPETKRDVAVSSMGQVVMVGDGVNDSASLAAASLGAFCVRRAVRTDPVSCERAMLSV